MLLFPWASEIQACIKHTLIRLYSTCCCTACVAAFTLHDARHVLEVFPQSQQVHWSNSNDTESRNLSCKRYIMLQARHGTCSCHIGFHRHASFKLDGGHLPGLGKELVSISAILSHPVGHLQAGPFASLSCMQYTVYICITHIHT